MMKTGWITKNNLKLNTTSTGNQTAGDNSLVRAIAQDSKLATVAELVIASVGHVWRHTGTETTR